MSTTVKLAGTYTVNDDGSFTLTLHGGAGGIPPIPPIPPPADMVILRPSGGDDHQALQDAWNALGSDQTLLVSGMLQISDSVSLQGSNKTVAGDPRVQSGLRSTCAGRPMSGPYCAMLHLQGLQHCTLRGLELDAAGTPSGLAWIEGGADNLVQGCYLHDVGWYGANPSPAALLSDGSENLIVRNNRVLNTGTGGPGADGTRGIWLRGAAYATVEGNHVSDTGHTCIVVEGAAAMIQRNSAKNCLANGTLFKLVYRGPQPAGEVHFLNNAGDNSPQGAGLMIESGPFSLVEIAGCVWKNNGAPGNTFGSLYVNGDWTTNIHYHDNTLENCQSIGALRYADHCLFENNSVASGPATLNLEESAKNIKLSNSGDVSIGANCSNVWVDGAQRA